MPQGYLISGPPAPQIRGLSRWPATRHSSVAGVTYVLRVHNYRIAHLLSGEVNYLPTRHLERFAHVYGHLIMVGAALLGKEYGQDRTHDERAALHRQPRATQAGDRWLH